MRRNQFPTVGGLRIVAEKAAESRDVLMDLAQGNVGAVPPKLFRSGPRGNHSKFVFIAEHELSGFGHRLPRQRVASLTLDVRTGNAVDKTKVFAAGRRQTDIKPVDRAQAPQAGHRLAADGGLRVAQFRRARHDEQADVQSVASMRHVPVRRVIDSDITEKFLG